MSLLPSLSTSTSRPRQTVVYVLPKQKNSFNYTGAEGGTYEENVANSVIPTDSKFIPSPLTPIVKTAP